MALGVFDIDGLTVGLIVFELDAVIVVVLLTDTLGLTEFDKEEIAVLEVLPDTLFDTLGLLLLDTDVLIVFDTIDVFVSVELPLKVDETVVLLEILALEDDEPERLG